MYGARDHDLGICDDDHEHRQNKDQQPQEKQEDDKLKVPSPRKDLRLTSQRSSDKNPFIEHISWIELSKRINPNLDVEENEDFENYQYDETIRRQSTLKQPQE